VLGILSEFDLSKVLLHWYDGPTEVLPSIHMRGYLVSFGPALLYSRRLARIAANADLSMILTETDAPVKYPGPFEGRNTQPSFVIEVVRKLAEINKVNIEEVRSSVLNNFHEFIL
jgi:TatD DNase family protein